MFQTQGLNSELPHGRQISYQLGQERDSKILEWVVYHFLVDLPAPGIKSVSPALQVDLRTELPGNPRITESLTLDVGKQ